MDNLAATARVDVAGQHLSPAAQKPYGQLVESLNTPSSPVVVKLVLPKRLHNYAIHQLAEMNVEATVLFPGLDGVARSLNRFPRLPSFESVRTR